MYTQCPQCLTIFEIDEDALQASLGIVHCGHCGRRFDALRTLSNTLPLEPDAPLAPQDPAERVPTLTDVVSPAAFESFARWGRQQGADASSPPAPQSDADGPPAPPVAGEAPPPESSPPGAGSGSDWFAAYETELTTSLRSEATAAALDDALTGHAWQVDELPAQARFTDPAIPITFEGFGREFGAADEVKREEPSADASPASNDGGAPDVPLPTPQGEAPPAHLLLAHDEQESDATVAAEVVSDGEPGPAEVTSDTAEMPAPVYVRPRRRRAAGVAWALGCLVLAAVLAVQLAWIKRVDLFRDPATHAWAARVCGMIACHLPPIRDVAKLELMARDVRPDPDAYGALSITATVRNDATFRQPWPVVVVELTDLDNHPVAMRRFRPAEYLPDPARRAAGIAPGATSAIAFEVADPGKRAVAFRFRFE